MFMHSTQFTLGTILDITPNHLWPCYKYCKLRRSLLCISTIKWDAVCNTCQRPAIMERRYIFVNEQDVIVKSCIRSLVAWRRTIDWVWYTSSQWLIFYYKGGFSWQPNLYLLSLLCIHANDTLTQSKVEFSVENDFYSFNTCWMLLSRKLSTFENTWYKQHTRITMTMIINLMARRVLTLEVDEQGPSNTIQWNRFYSCKDYNLPFKPSPDSAPIIRWLRLTFVRDPISIHQRPRTANDQCCHWSTFVEPVSQRDCQLAEAAWFVRWRNIKLQWTKRRDCRHIKAGWLWRDKLNRPSTQQWVWFQATR